MKGKPVERDVDRMRAAIDGRDGTDRLPDRAAIDSAARSHRRRRGVVGGAAIALVAACVVVTPHLLKTSPTTNDATDPTNGAAIAADPARTDPCPEDPIDVSKPAEVPELPVGAVSVRLCRAAWSDPDSTAIQVSSWPPPAEALIADAPAFAAAVDALPAWEPDDCANVDYVGEPFAIVVSYAETSYVLGARAPLCNPIRIKGTDVDAADVVAAYERLTGPLPWQS